MPDSPRPPAARDCLDCGLVDGMKLQNAARTQATNIPLLYVCEACGCTLTIPPARSPIEELERSGEEEHMNVPVRDRFAGPELLSSAWTLTKGEKHAACEVWSHALGYELRLGITGDPHARTRVCKSQKELIGRQNEWRTGLEAEGWAK